MPPHDPTPLGDEMVERLPERKFPQPEQGRQDAHERKRADEAARAAADVRNRPPLPDHPQRLAADIEDEDADPVIDTGPGIDDGPKGLKKQKG